MAIQFIITAHTRASVQIELCMDANNNSNQASRRESDALLQ